MLVHNSPTGEKRCVATEWCPYGGAIGRTLSRRGDQPLSPKERDLPLVTTGTTTRGGAATSVEEIMDKTEADENYLQKRFRQRKEETTATPRDNTNFGADEESWKTTPLSEKAERLQQSIGTVRRLLWGHARTAQQDENLSVKVVDAAITVQPRMEKGVPTLYVGKAFLESSSLQHTWFSFVQAYGKVAFKGNRDSWSVAMKRAGVPTDFQYLSQPQHTYPYVTACGVCRTGSYRPDTRQPYCTYCWKKYRRKNRVTFKPNKDFKQEGEG